MPGKLNGCCQLGQHGSATGGRGMAVSSLPEAGSLPRNRSMCSTQICLMDMDEYMGVSKNRDTPKWMDYNGNLY